jgi:hypothetical protein
LASDVKPALSFPADAATYAKSAMSYPMRVCTREPQNKGQAVRALKRSSSRTFAKEGLDVSADIGAVAIFENIV